MYDVREYLVLYLRLDHLAEREDLLSIGVREESIELEEIQQKRIMDTLTEMLLQWSANLKTQQPSYAESVGEHGVHVSHFGPLALAYLPYLNKDSAKALYSLAALALPRVLRKMGTCGRLVRGSFVKGFGWEIVEGSCRTLYGPVMAKAWHYMIDHAYSPRILIEQSIFRVVSERSSYGPGPDGDWLPRYARMDFDGQGIFDWLAYDLDSYSVQCDTAEGAIAEMKAMLQSLHNVSEKLAIRYAEHDNSKSVRNLMYVIDYVKRSISTWTGKLGQEIFSSIEQ